MEDEAEELHEILRRVGLQDRAAFATLYQRTAPKLNGIVRRILPEMQLADDVMQDVYVRVWRGAAGYEPARGRPITWLAAIARNLAIDVRRREQSRGLGRHETFDTELAQAVVPGIDAEDSAALRSCLDRLEPVHREMIVSAYCGGLSREELATAHRTPVGTVKSWLHRGLATLRKCLGGE
jgi:RNA polymerase sigma-70 factor (ECF subfamily)